ncbi:hypothetical protein CORC01_08647, partial [Colletotrichum orchidophilum]
IAPAAAVCEPVRAGKEVTDSLCALRRFCVLKVVSSSGLLRALLLGLIGSRALGTDHGMKSARSRRVSPIREENNKRVTCWPIRRIKSHDCASDWLSCPIR